jgi:phospholipase C
MSRMRAPGTLGAWLLAASLLAMQAAASGVWAAPPGARGYDRIDHIVVIYLENHSFDNLYGHFPGANGIGDAGATALQTDPDGKPYATLPPVLTLVDKQPAPDNRFPADLPNAPFLIDRYVKLEEKVPDLVHRWYQQQAQIHGGKMDRFVAVSNAKALAMGYHDISQTGLYRYAQRYTLADNFFQAAFGGSFLNHFWLICACTPRFENAPAALRAVEDAQGQMVKDGAVTPAGWAVNTVYSTYQPHPASVKDPATLLPPQTEITIGDMLTAKGVSWAWYSGGWNNALAGKPDPIFQYHHQPFAYFERYGDGTKARQEHLKDEVDLVRDIEQDTLPAVVFYKPLGAENQHPGYADVTSGDRHVTALIEKIERSPAWAGTVVVVTYDENGGYWDHVPPPVVDKWGPGTRVPTLVISPFARKNCVDHTLYDTTSILKMIETRHGLSPLGERDFKANDLLKALELQPVQK